MMEVYKKNGAETTIPYFDNCYVSKDGTKRDLLDTVVQDVDAYLAFANVNQIDYIQFRKKCKEVFLPLWSTLDNETKQKLIVHNIAPTQADKDLFYTMEQQLEHYKNIVATEINARLQRFNEAMFIAAFKLPDDGDRLAMYYDISQYKFPYVDADLPNLILWLQNGIYPPLGIDYTLSGFRSKSYYSLDIEQSVLEVLTK